MFESFSIDNSLHPRNKTKNTSVIQIRMKPTLGRQLDEKFPQSKISTEKNCVIRFEVTKSCLILSWNFFSFRV